MQFGHSFGTGESRRAPGFLDMQAIARLGLFNLPGLNQESIEY